MLMITPPIHLRDNRNLDWKLLDYIDITIVPARLRILLVILKTEVVATEKAKNFLMVQKCCEYIQKWVRPVCKFTKADATSLEIYRSACGWLINSILSEA